MKQTRATSQEAKTTTKKTTRTALNKRTASQKMTLKATSKKNQPTTEDWPTIPKIMMLK